VTGYVPALDGLRAVAVLLVVAAHCGLDGLVPGGFGVTLFFFISGLLITGQLAAEHARTGRIAFAGFYLRRALRLMPAGVIYVVVAGAAFAALGGVITPAGWLAALGYGANYYDLFVRYASTLPGVRHPFNVLWSLSVEDHFYLVWPLALAALLRRRGGAVGVLLAVCAMLPAWRLVLHATAHAPPAWLANRIYKATDTRLDSLAWGALVALLAGGQALRPAVRRRWLQAAMLGVLLASFLIRGPAFRDVARYTLQGAALAVLVPALLAADTPLRRALALPPAVLIGRLSYSIYLWHWAALSAADAWQPAGGAAWLAVALGLTVALSVASYAGVERPMLRLRRRFGSRAPARLPLGRFAHERVAAPLVADAGVGAMAADEGDVVAQRQQLAANAGEQRRLVAIGEVGAADRAVEQRVAHHGEA
jgi:peptidoglycan/LPS O-acetylase OafA/YrhL